MNAVEDGQTSGGPPTWQFYDNEAILKGTRPTELSHPTTYGLLNGYAPEPVGSERFDDTFAIRGQCPLSWWEGVDPAQRSSEPFYANALRYLSAPIVHGSSDVTAAGLMSDHVLHEHWVESWSYPVEMLVATNGGPGGRAIGSMTETRAYDVHYCPMTRGTCP